MVGVEVKLNLSPFTKFRDIIAKGLATGDSANPIRKAFRQMAFVYRAWAQRRFDRFSRGGGWPPLAESTIDRRRHGKGGGYKRGKAARARAESSGGGQVSILRDTGTLFNALAATGGAPGSETVDIPNGIRTGYGGPSKHPKGAATIADIASFHDQGLGRVPRRPIIVAPDEATKTRMSEVLEAACQAASAEAGAK